MVQEHIRRYRELLADLIALAGFNKKQIGERLGWSRGQVTKVMQGRNELKLSQLLSILETIGVEPLDFFLLAHGAHDIQEGTLPARVLGKFKTEGGKPPLVLPPVLSEEELERRIEEIVRRVMKHPES